MSARTRRTTAWSRWLLSGACGAVLAGAVLRSRSLPAREEIAASEGIAASQHVATADQAPQAARTDSDTRTGSSAASITDRSASGGSAGEFAALFAKHCAGCHGAEGRLGGAPSLNDPLYRGLVSLKDLQSTISAGRPGTPMPPFAREHGGPLSAAQIQQLALAIKGNAEPRQATGPHPGWGTAASVPASAPELEAADAPRKLTGAEAEQIRQTTFAKACAGCHEARGQGGKMAGAISEPAFLQLSSDRFLRRMVVVGRADLNMPDYASTAGRGPGQPLSTTEVDDLVALLAHWREHEPPAPAATGPASEQ
ncbi:MAG TPA: c-type cytochrome [Pirellulales bacterium]|jgi:mono/diheme cytochrome c family protein|nr:c-type cytochrome [Pirellulales bacterium]